MFKNIEKDLSSQNVAGSKTLSVKFPDANELSANASPQMKKGSTLLQFFFYFHSKARYDGIQENVKT